MKIEVKQRHIDNGEPADAHCCAIALAVSEATDEDVWVDEYTILIGDTSYRTPRQVANFIEQFDDNPRYCQPFEFDLVYVDY